MLSWKTFRFVGFFFLFTLTHSCRKALRCFFKYSDSTFTPTVSNSTRCVSFSSGHDVRFALKTHNFPSKSCSCVVDGHVQFTTGQGKHFARSTDGCVPGAQRTQDFDANGEPLASVSTRHNMYNINITLKYSLCTQTSL